MYQVIITNKFMQDFVTSRTSVMVFSTLEICEEYVKSCEAFHPGRQWYQIAEYTEEDKKCVRKHKRG